MFKIDDAQRRYPLLLRLMVVVAVSSCCLWLAGCTSSEGPESESQEQVGMNPESDGVTLADMLTLGNIELGDALVSDGYDYEPGNYDATYSSETFEVYVDNMNGYRVITPDDASDLFALLSGLGASFTNLAEYADSSENPFIVGVCTVAGDDALIIAGDGIIFECTPGNMEQVKLISPNINVDSSMTADEAASVFVESIVSMGYSCVKGDGFGIDGEQDGFEEDPAGRDASASSSINTAVKSSLNDYTWAELSSISDMIRNRENGKSAIDVAKEYHLCTDDGMLDGSQTKDVTLSNGVKTQVQVLDFDREGTGIIFVFKDAVHTGSMNTNHGWEESGMRQYLNSDFLTLLPADLQSVVVPMEKLTNNAGTIEQAAKLGVTVTDGTRSDFTTIEATTTSDKMWLLSVKEIAGSVKLYEAKMYQGTIDKEGEQYKLYKDTNVQDDDYPEILRKTYVGNDETAAMINDENNDDCCGWWLRTADPKDENGRWIILSNGSLCSWEEETGGVAFGIVPCFGI